MDSLFQEKGIGEPSVHSVFFEKDAVWITANAHSRARGGLLRLRRGSADGWTLFRKELTGGEQEPARLDLLELYADDEHLWVFFSMENSYNFILAVYDKAAGTWRSHAREQAIPELLKLADAVPKLRWARRSDLATRINELASEAPKLGSDHPYRMPKRALPPFKQAAAKLLQAFTSQSLLDRPSPGSSDYVVWDGKIVPDRRRGEAEAVALPFKGFFYTHLLYALSQQEVLVGTAQGFLRIDLKARRLRPLSGSTPLGSDGSELLVAPFAEGKKLMLYETPPGDEPRPLLRVADLGKDTLADVTLPNAKSRTDPPKAVGVIGEQLAVRTTRGALLTFEPGPGAGGGTWKKAAAGASFRPAKSPDERLRLPEGGELELRPNGIWQHPAK